MDSAIEMAGNGSSARGSGLGDHTFLFAGIEDSAPQWERSARLMSRALALHDEIVGAAIVSNGGVVIRYTGDGVVARFPSCDAALSGAVAIQTALSEAPWPDGFNLRVRIGLHHGLAEARGNDFYGRSVNLAARLMNTAQGTQILLSGLVKQRLVAAHPVEFRDEGRRLLKGIATPVQLWTALVPGVTGELGPLSRIGASTIPVAADDLIGRDRDLAEVADALDHHRLVTLTGPPGSGKTRLAIEAAGQARAGNPAGVHVVELAALRSPTDIAGAVAGVVLGPEPAVGDAGHTPALQRLAAAIDRDLLVVLDNGEHIVDSVGAFVREALATIASLRLLLTSREVLLSAGEQVVEIGPLDVAAEGPAVQLFLQRARAVGSDLSEVDTDLVTDICQRLDGLPLAIELAAARLDVLSLADLNARLFDELGAPGRDTSRVDRHATIDAAVRWSWDLLDENERIVLARASVFAGAFDLDAATAICGGNDLDPLDVIDLLGSLKNRSLISTAGQGSSNRFRLLEIVRRFAASQLDDEAAAATRRRHRDHFGSTSPII